MKASVIRTGDQTITDLGGGVSRCVLSHNQEMMLVRVMFETGGIGAMHAHPHTQSTYVVSGKFRFTIDGRDEEVCAGDTITFPSGIPHGTICLEKGELIDIFTPCREDFLK
ncbi:MAG: cupin domain-containing protein [Clostridia bacterium]|nr:cupin domain-containing protein [Clostridia bacterium]